jgi:hypothetical protein
VLGEFFAARSEDLDDVLVEEGPYGRLATVEAKGLTEVSIATLGEILGVGTHDELVERIGEGPQAESEEAGVLTIPTELRDVLAEARDINTVAAGWAATDELSLDGWRIEDSLRVLRELSALAREAAADGRELWYWWSL